MTEKAQTLEKKNTKLLSDLELQSKVSEQLQQQVELMQKQSHSTRTN